MGALLLPQIQSFSVENTVYAWFVMWQKSEARQAYNTKVLPVRAKLNNS